MKVAFFIGKLGTGGAERQLVNLSQGLYESGHDVTVFTIYPGGQNAETLAQYNGPEIVTLWGRRGGDAIQRSLQVALAPLLFRKALNRHRPDIVYSMLYMTNLIAWLATRGHFSKCLVWGLRASNMTLNMKRVVPERLCSILSRSVPLAIANSYAGMEHHKRRGYHCRKKVVVPNGIDTAKFFFSGASRADIRREFGVSLTQPLIGIVARFDPMKDYPSFLKAASLVVKERPDAKFLCVGDGPSCYAKSLHALSEKLCLQHHMVWTGERHDMPAIYSALDVLCSSSSFGEGFPNVIGEAMACEVTCVVTDVGDSAEIVKDTGQVVRPCDEKALARAILTILNREGDVKSNPFLRNRVNYHYSVAAMVKNTEMILLGVSD